MHLDIRDPRFSGCLMLLAALAVAVLQPTFFMEVILTVAFSAVLAPGIDWLRRKLGLSVGLTVASIAFLIIAILGLAGWYGVPLFVRGINETIQALPESSRKLMPFVQEWLGAWKVRLEGLFPSEGSLDELIKKKLPELAGPGSDLLKVFVKTALGSLVAIGHILLFLVLTAILLGEWEDNKTKARYLLDLYLPGQSRALAAFGEKFQHYGVELFVGIGTVMLIFMPVFFALLYFYGGLPLGKSLLFGVILGATSAIPTIGGIFTYLILVIVGLLNFGVSPEGLKTTLTLYVVAFIVHFAETKFVTPRVLGHKISFTSFAVITTLVGSVLMFGVGRGILAGLFLLVVLKALTEVVDEFGWELRGVPGKASASAVATAQSAVAATAIADVPAPPAPIAVSPSARGPATPPKPDLSSRPGKRRR